MNSSHVAEGKFLAGYNCAQAVLFAHCDNLGIDKDLALRLACGLGAGVAREGEICGAVSGAIVAIGIKYGRGEGEDKAKAEETYARAAEFMAKFKERHGSVSCRELTGCDLRTAEGRRVFVENDLLHRTCARCVETADEFLLAEIGA